MAPVDHWPLFGLRVRTPRLELRYPDDELCAAVAEVAASGVHDPGSRPFLRQWTDIPPPQQQRNTMQHLWRARGAWTPTSWVCPLAVIADGEVAGLQSVEAVEFPGRRTALTGSWLGMSHQGRGLGTEMRAAVLHLVFAGLGAAQAESAAWHDNQASLTVSRKLGYEENGVDRMLRGDGPDRMVRLLLTRSRWEQRRRDDIEIDGLEPCLPFFGAVATEWLVP